MQKTTILKLEVTNLQEYEELLVQAESVLKKLETFKLEVKRQAPSLSMEKEDKAQPQKQ